MQSGVLSSCCSIISSRSFAVSGIRSSLVHQQQTVAAVHTKRNRIRKEWADVGDGSGNHPNSTSGSANGGASDDHNKELIGPPHPLSNIRPFVIPQPENESKLHRKYRLLKHQTAEFNHQFWAQHNKQFNEEREAYVQRVLRDKHGGGGSALDKAKTNLTAEEMSEFYKDFLDRKLSSHKAYNLEWQARNFKLVCLSVAVAIENLFRRK